ncbi:hypothetical protein LCGC14_2686360 [marine sediment metagenome]|uniref:Uncharacterized protein n=1 Tax=marine sediment metagenome TaxID=412755 RepID=A0A0F8ZJV4_9ZZZZ
MLPREMSEIIQAMVAHLKKTATRIDSPLAPIGKKVDELDEKLDKLDEKVKELDKKIKDSAK